MAKNIAVVGFGNVGKAVAGSLVNYPNLYPDMRLGWIFTRRPEKVRDQVHQRLKGLVHDSDDIYRLKEKPDVAILCDGASALLDGGLGPEWLGFCNTVCSFDDHGKTGHVPQYFAAMNYAAKKAGHVAVIGTGWDPGTFSFEGVYANAFLGVKAYRFYGLTEKGGLSMGHSQHVREVNGVADALQYTHAIPETIEQVRAGERRDFGPGDMHWREVLAVLKTGANADRIREEIVNMPGYFKPYRRVEVNFVTQDELEAQRQQRGMAHDGLVIAVSDTGIGHKAVIEYRCQWDSNPEGTARIMLAYARAVARLNNQLKPGWSGALASLVRPFWRLQRGYVSGAFTTLDIPAALLSSHGQDELLINFV